MTDIDHIQRFIVEIPTFGDPERERANLLHAVARAIHYSVKPRAKITDDTRTTWRFDALGSDGHHPDHGEALIHANEVLSGEFRLRDGTTTSGYVVPGPRVEVDPVIHT